VLLFDGVVVHRLYLLRSDTILRYHKLDRIAIY
jgi:hypothetical protein